jgi:acyl-CoA hydrolase
VLTAQICVTASIDDVEFVHPVNVGDRVSVTAKVTRAFKTSMEVLPPLCRPLSVKVFVSVEAEDMRAAKPNTSTACTAYLTFVVPKGAEVPLVEPQTEVEKRM